MSEDEEQPVHLGALRRAFRDSGIDPCGCHGELAQKEYLARIKRGTDPVTAARCALAMVRLEQARAERG